MNSKPGGKLNERNIFKQKKIYKNNIIPYFKKLKDSNTINHDNYIYLLYIFNQLSN